MFPHDHRLTFRTNMKKLALLCFSAITLFHTHAQARVEINFDFFYDSLAPLGEWSKVGGYGYVWHPSDVDADWSPYSDGYWSYTDAGWTWVSYEDWGGITYHYGRWAEIEDYGWCWVPGYEWGPAWVSWRKNEDHVGWAPLPPEAHFRRDTGFGVWVDTHFDIGPGSFRFCNVRDFGAPVLRNVFLPRSENINFISNTINITNISYRRDNGYAFNGGIDYDWIAPRSERPVPALKLVQNTTNIYVTGNKGNVFINSAKGNQLIVAAPPVSQQTNYNTPTRQLVVAKTIAAPVISHGWAGLNKGAQRDQLLMKMREQDRGVTPATAPARAVKTAQLAVIPKKGDPNAKLPSVLKVPADRTPQTSPVAGVPTPAGAVQPAVEGQPGVVAKPHTVTPQTSAQPAIAAEPTTAKPTTAAGDTQPKHGPGGLRGKPSATDLNGDGKPDRALPVARPERPDAKVAEQPAAKPESVTETKADRLLKARQQNEAATQATKAAAAERAQQAAQTARTAKEQKDASKAAAAAAKAEANARDSAVAAERANALRQQKAESQQRTSEAAAEKRRQAAEADKAAEAKHAAAAAARREAAQNAAAESAQQNAARRAAQEAARREAQPPVQRQPQPQIERRPQPQIERQPQPQIQRQPQPQPQIQRQPQPQPQIQHQPQPQQQSLQPGQEQVPQDPRKKKKPSAEQ